MVMSKTMQLHPLAELFPPMRDEEFKGLIEDIRKNGLREPIITHDGTVLDGRNRYRACIEIGIEPLTRPWDGKGDPIDFVLSKNLHRRHLKEGQRAMIADRVATLKEGRPKKETASIEAVKASAQAEAADRLKVGRSSVQRARIVREKGIPELQAAVVAGEVSVSAASEVAKLPKSRQQEIMSGGVKKIMASAKTIRRRQKPQKREAQQERPRETEHERDMKILWDIWGSVCLSARQEFLCAIRDEINEAFTAGEMNVSAA